MEKEPNSPLKKASSPLKETSPPRKPTESSFQSSIGPLSDFSPVKGAKSISYFFTPPKAVPSRSALSPQRESRSSPSQSMPKFKVARIISDIKETNETKETKNVNYNNSASESDLTMSEGEADNDIGPSVTTRSISSNPIPLNLNENELEHSSDSKKDSVAESESDSSLSDISVIISLPSSDSIGSERKGNSRPTFATFNNYEYEETEDEGIISNIPISIDSEEENENSDKIPLMVFNSSNSRIDSPTKSPYKKPKSPVRNSESSIKKLSPPSLSSKTSDKPVITSNSSDVQVQPIRLASLPENSNDSTTEPSKSLLQTYSSFSENVLNDSRAVETKGPPFKTTGFVYDERMLHHSDPHDPEHPERPARITCIYEKLRAAGLLDRSYRIPVIIKLADFTPEVQAVHDPKYCKKINQTSLMTSLDDLGQFSSQFNSVYISPSTAISATVAAAATIDVCLSVACGQVENGFAIVRPPGHHAEHDEAMGFCIYNNVAVAASTLLRRKLASRILILDWDIHHGNGTQNSFAESGDVLYISIHRFDGGKFYPHIDEASSVYVGSGAGLGKSVNVAWNGPGFGDADYLFAFSRLIMPIAREFNPDFVIVSAGFDAAAGDPIGECEVTPYGYSIMLGELMTLAAGKLALVLEGGYNLDVISRCYEACVRVLLKEAPPAAPGPMVASPKAIFAVESTVISQSSYWKCLFPKPAQLSLSENTPQIPLTTILDHFWREECRQKFHLSPMRGLFKSCSESFMSKYANRVLGSEGVHFSPEVLIVFAHESGPIHSNSFISSLCLQAGKINQSHSFLPLLQSVQETNYAVIDVCLPTRSWKLKQTSLGNEVEAQELNVLFTLIWDRLIATSRCKNVFFVASGSPIFSIANLINIRNVEDQIRGCFFFSSSLFIPTISQSPLKADWYRRHSYIAVPSQEIIKKPIGNAAASFGSCYSSGQWIMSDSAAAVGDFKYEVLNFIRTRII